MSSIAASPPLSPAAAGDARRPSTLTITRWELRKLLSQKRSYLGFGIVMLLPLIFVISQHLRGRGHGGAGDIFESQITQSGLATPVLMLLFESVFMLPLAASLVAGDIVASEDGNGTLKTILTRSVDRGQVFAAKVLAAALYAATAVYLSALTSAVAGIASWGFHGIRTYTGTYVSAPKALLLVTAANGAYLIPLLTIVCIGVLLSTVTHNSAASIVGTLALTLLLALITQIPGLEGLAPYMLPHQYESWQGLLRTPTDWAPIWHSAWVCALYAGPALAAAYLVLIRRDVTGG